MKLNSCDAILLVLVWPSGNPTMQGTISRDKLLVGVYGDCPFLVKSHLLDVECHAISGMAVYLAPNEAAPPI